MRLELEELFFNTVFLALTVYSTDKLYRIVSQYEPFGDILATPIILLAGSLIALYLSIRLALIVFRIAEYFEEHVATKLWIVPNVYRKIVFKGIALTLMVIFKPIIMASASLLMSSDLYVEIAELLYNIAIIVLLVNLAYDLYRTLEHIIHSRIPSKPSGRG